MTAVLPEDDPLLQILKRMIPSVFRSEGVYPRGFRLIPPSGKNSWVLELQVDDPANNRSVGVQAPLEPGTHGAAVVNPHLAMSSMIHPQLKKIAIEIRKELERDVPLEEDAESPPADPGVPDNS